MNARDEQGNVTGQKASAPAGAFTRWTATQSLAERQLAAADGPREPVAELEPELAARLRAEATAKRLAWLLARERARALELDQHVRQLVAELEVVGLRHAQILRSKPRRRVPRLRRALRRLRRRG